MLRVIDDFELQALRSKAIENERKKWFIASRHQKELREIRQENADQELLDLAASIVLADPIEVKAFRADLDTYDALTIEAIMENREILERLYLERDAMLDNAYQLEDGTHVFKSENGNVFDEDGNRVSEDIVHPDMISDGFTKAEPFFKNKAAIYKHEIIDEKLLDYQEKLDAARERLDDGELTQEEFNELKEGIEKDMPIEVRRKLPDHDQSQETDLTSDFTATNAVEQAAKLAPADMAINAGMVNNF